MTLVAFLLVVSVNNVQVLGAGLGVDDLLLKLLHGIVIVYVA